MFSDKLRYIVLASTLLAATTLSTANAAAADLVIFDNDWDTATSLIPILANPDIKLLGITTVTGDGWRDEETAHVLRFLEDVGRADIPVYNGAVFPLINTAVRTAAWEQLYGKIPWKGAWNPRSMGANFHPDEPFKIIPPYDGLPHTRPASENAADFMIDAVHRYPHRVTIIAAGPLTTIALAIRLDPEFALLAKQLVIMGALVDTNLLQVTGSANFNSDFNFIFDPEAAHIALTGNWAHVVIMGDVTNSVIYDQSVFVRMEAKHTPAERYIARSSQIGLPLWDEMTAAIVADPTLVTQTLNTRMDVDIANSVNYGHAHVWPESIAPHQGEAEVTIVQAIDAKRFIDEYVAAAHGDWSTAK